MPISPIDTRATRRYFTTIANLKLALGIPGGTVVAQWGWERVGLNGIILATGTPVPTPDNPVSGVTREVTTQAVYAFQDIFDVFFAGVVSPAEVARLTMSFDVTNAYFDLNQVEH